MAMLEEQLLFVLFIFAFLVVMRSVPRIIQFLALFGLSYACYLWSWEYLQKIYIYLMAAWNARHLSQLSETCRNVVNIRVPERHYPWYEQYLQCTGEFWGVEAWRTYHDYTSPHYLLLYLTVFLFIQYIIKQGGNLLNAIFDSQLPSVDDLDFCSKQREKEIHAGSLICRVLQNAVLKNQISKLENDLKAERGKIWTIKSPTSSFRVSPAASLLKPPSQDATLAMNLQAELDAAKQEIEDLKNTASSAKASRKLTVKFAASTKCDAEEDARRTALMNDLEVARGEAASSKAAAEVAETIIGQLNKQILGLKKEGRDLETANQDMIRCNDALVEAASHHNSPFVIEVARLSSLNFLYLSEGQILQNTLDSTRTELATVTRSCDDKQRSLDAVKYKLSNAQAASSQHEQSIQQLEDRVKSLKTEISCTMEARKEAVEGHEKAQEDHAAVEERIKLLTLDGDDQDIHQMKMLNQSLESNLEESKRALEAEKEESRKAKERQQQLEADLEDEALATDLKLAEKDMVIDDLRSQAGTENTALFDKRVTRLDPAVLKAEQEMARLEGELGTMRDDMSKLQGKLTDATKELERQKRKAEEQRAADKAKVILFNERFEAIQVKLATKTAELDEVKREVEEQKAVISELRDTDSLFED